MIKLLATWFNDDATLSSTSGQSPLERLPFVSVYFPALPRCDAALPTTAAYSGNTTDLSGCL